MQIFKRIVAKIASIKNYILSKALRIREYILREHSDKLAHMFVLYLISDISIRTFGVNFWTLGVLLVFAVATEIITAQTPNNRTSFGDIIANITGIMSAFLVQLI